MYSPLIVPLLLLFAALIIAPVAVSPAAASTFPGDEDPFAEERAGATQPVSGQSAGRGTGLPALRRTGDQRFFGEFSFRASRAELAGDREQALEQGYGWILGGQLGQTVNWAYLGDFARGDFGRSDLRDPEETELLAHLASLTTKIGPADRLSFTGQFHSGTAFGQPFYSSYRPDVANPPWRSWNSSQYNAQWDHAAGDGRWLHCRLSGAGRSGTEGARDGSSMEAKQPADYGMHDFRGYRELDEQAYAAALGWEARQFLANTHALEVWVQARGKDASETHALVTGGGQWPGGQQNAWTADAQSREYFAELRHHWQISRWLFLDSALETAHFNYIEPGLLLLPRMTLTFLPVPNTAIHGSIYQEASTPPYLFAFERPLNDYTTRDQAWADHSLIKPELSQCIELGIERTFAGQYQVGIEGFYKRLEDVILSYDLWHNLDADPWTSKRVYWNAGDGSVYGFSTMLRKHMSHDFSAWVRYLWSEATGQSFQGPSWRAELPYSFPDSVYLDDDVRHSFKFVLDYDTARLGGIGANIAWNYHTGHPFTPIRRYSYDPSTGRPPLQAMESLNSSRVPDWSELNVLMTKNITYLAWLDVQLRVQVVNVLNHVNIKDVNELSGDAEPMPFGGNTGSSRKMIAGFLFKF